MTPIRNQFAYVEEWIHAEDEHAQRLVVAKIAIVGPGMVHSVLTVLLEADADNDTDDARDFLAQLISVGPRKKDAP